MRALFSIFFLTPILLLADHAQVRSRPMSPEAFEQFSSERRLEEEVEVRLIEEAAGFCPEEPSSASYHWMVSFIDEGLTIEDGSVWQIDPWHTFKLRDWQSDDPLIITQNRIWYSNWRYRIVNRNSGSSIPVNSLVGPEINNVYTLSLSRIDLAGRRVTLTDGSQWLISNRDELILNDWLIHDVITIGFNSGWESDFEYILINANVDNFVRAKQL